jgi:Kef-type K+ transport system membrane component KefB
MEMIGLAVPPVSDASLLVFWCQLAVLLICARLMGSLLARFGQPRVIGELLAGVALGPSIAGRLAPGAWGWLFPDDATQSGLLLGLAWFGIVLVLMSAGVETDLGVVRRHGRAAITTSLASLVLPLAAGVALGWSLPARFVGDDGRRWVFALFIGIALAISSLPVAARILRDLGLQSRPIGQLVMAAAVTNDVIGWLLLGLVVGLAETGSVAAGDLVVAVIGMAAVSILVLVVGPRGLNRVVAIVRSRGSGDVSMATVAVVFTVTVGIATHAIGLEVVIGAFLAGVAIGRSDLRTEPALHQLDSMTTAIFAPLFFAVAGLRVDLTALARVEVLAGAVAVTVVATLGKLIGAYLGARWGGMARREAFGVGAALNARGALEVVIATVGLSIGVLNDASYAAIVLMAIATSALAAPLLRLTGLVVARGGVPTPIADEADEVDVVPLAPPVLDAATRPSAMAS